MAHKLLDITPTPEVLFALTRTPITPLDALSELIDNAIDSFRAAEIAGTPSPVRHVVIEVPGPSQIERGEGSIRVRDTGPGLTSEQIANAMRAGYTSKNHFDTLGLFGMGFNIATGKLGRTTQVISARAEDDHAIRVTLDLPELVRSRAFEVKAEEITKPAWLEHGTVVEVRGWWPKGDANHGFIREVARITKRHFVSESVGGTRLSCVAPPAKTYGSLSTEIHAVLLNIASGPRVVSSNEHPTGASQPSFRLTRKLGGPTAASTTVWTSAARRFALDAIAPKAARSSSACTAG